MNNFEALNDAYILGLTEQGFEPEVVAFCKHCNNELYEGEEAVVDDFGNVFCDFQCGKEFHKIGETCDAEGELFCLCCGSELFAEDYAVYTNDDGDLFCTEECAEQWAGLKYKTLEKEGN